MPGTDGGAPPWTRPRQHWTSWRPSSRSVDRPPAAYLQLSTAIPLAQAVTCASVQAATSVAVAEQLEWLQSQLFKVES